MDAVAMVVGQVVIWCVLIAAAALSVIGAAKLVNRAVWELLGCYGGIKTFNEFRRWYYTQRLATPTAQAAQEGQKT